MATRAGGLSWMIKGYEKRLRRERRCTKETGGSFGNMKLLYSPFSFIVTLRNIL